MAPDRLSRRAVPEDEWPAENQGGGGRSCYSEGPRPASFLSHDTHLMRRNSWWKVCHLEGTFRSQCTTGLI